MSTRVSIFALFALFFGYSISAGSATENPMKHALKSLLNQLDEIASRYEEVEDTDVREQMWAAIDKGLIRPVPGYVLPKELGMFSSEGNAAVRKAIETFLKDPEVMAAGSQLPRPVDRLNAFQDGDVVSDRGTRYDDYFGYLPPKSLE